MKKRFDNAMHRYAYGFSFVEVIVTISITSLFITAALQLYTAVESQRISTLRQSVAIDIAETNLKKFYDQIALTSCATEIDLTSSFTPENTNKNASLNNFASSSPITQSVKGYPVDGCTGTLFNSTVMRLESVVTYGTQSEKSTSFITIQTTNLSSPISVEYLLVAGGGGGGGVGGGAGGGGGGVRTGTLTLATGIAYTITVGAGGAGTTSGSARGGNGGNSVLTTIAAIGGGGGGATTATGVLSCSSGGSGGGGAGGINSYGGGGSCGAYSGQGFAGGPGSGLGGSGGGGGNGGGGAAGSSVGGGGGVGTARTITGTSVYYGGGGGGGQATTAGTGPSAGGTGGGGNGGRYPTAPTNGTANTGGGGGGSYRDSVGGGIAASGGSGVVVLKIPNTYTATFSTGVISSVNTSVAGFKIYRVTSAGTTASVTFNKV